MQERKKNKYITYEDRLYIKKMCLDNVPVKQMAIILDVNIATVYRELRRGGVELIKYQKDISPEQRKIYDPEVAQKNLRK